MGHVCLLSFSCPLTSVALCYTKKEVDIEVCFKTIIFVYKF